MTLPTSGNALRIDVCCKPTICNGVHHYPSNRRHILFFCYIKYSIIFNVSVYASFLLLLLLPKNNIEYSNIDGGRHMETWLRTQSNRMYTCVFIAYWSVSWNCLLYAHKVVIYYVWNGFLLILFLWCRFFFFCCFVNLDHCMQLYEHRLFVLPLNARINKPMAIQKNPFVSFFLYRIAIG